MRWRAWRNDLGFTLIELMVVVALIAIIVTLSAPSFKRLTESQRVTSLNAQLVTDLQLARTEAVSRAAKVRVTFRNDATMTCYSIYTYASNGTSCDCRQPVPCAAAGAGYTEIKTTRVYKDRGVFVYPLTGVGVPLEFAFEPLAGGLYTIPLDVEWQPLQSYVIRTFIDSARELRTTVGQSGRPTVCAPAGSTMREPAC